MTYPYKPPRSKWYEISDVFTRMDEELAVIIRQLDILLAYMSLLSGVPVETVKKAVEKIVSGQSTSVSEAVKTIVSPKITVPVSISETLAPHISITAQPKVTINTSSGKMSIDLVATIEAPLRMLPPQKLSVFTQYDTKYTFGDTTILAWIMPWNTDIYISNVPTSNGTPFPVTSGTLLTLRPSRDQRTIYMRAISTSGEVYILEFEKGE